MKNIYKINGYFRSIIWVKCNNLDEILYFNAITFNSDEPFICRKDGCGGKVKPYVLFGKKRIDKFNWVMVLQVSIDLVWSIRSEQKNDPLRGISNISPSKKKQIPLFVINPVEPPKIINPHLFFQGDINQICRGILEELNKKLIK